MELREVEELAVLLREQPISEIELIRQGSRIQLRKGAAAVTGAAPTAVSLPEAAPAPVDRGSHEATPVDTSILLSSEIVGLFHHAAPPCRVGSTIKAGQVVGNIEAMKLMNEVVAQTAGQVAEVMIEEGEPVDYGRALFRIVPK